MEATIKVRDIPSEFDIATGDEATAILQAFGCQEEYKTVFMCFDDNGNVQAAYGIFTPVPYLDRTAYAISV